MSLTRMARELEMRTVVIDGRDRYATRERFPDADEIRVGMPSEIVATYRATPQVAVDSRRARLQVRAARACARCIRSNVGYLGMLGSKKRGAAVRELLKEEGFTDDELARVRTPIGLDIGGKSPAGSRAVDSRRGRRRAQRKAATKRVGVTAFRAVVIEHFRRPRNRGPLPDANASAEGANPLCGDRIRMQVSRGRRRSSTRDSPPMRVRSASRRRRC